MSNLLPTRVGRFIARNAAVKGLIGVVDEHNLETLIEAGNAAIHRGWRPTNQKLDTMMDILEQFIARAFVEPAEEARLRVEAAKVKAVVPPQALRPKKTVVAPAVSLEAPKTS